MNELKARRWIALGIGAFVLIFSFITTISFALQTYTQGTALSGGEQTVVREGNTSGQIALLEISGPIINSGEEGFFASGGYNHQSFLNGLNAAMTDRQVEGIIISVDSPGGGVLESAEIHRLVEEAQSVHEKPVFVSMGGMAASGGYYIAAPAERIFAHPQTLTGSIGVIMSSINVSELLENIGVEENVYKSGPYKDILSPTREPLEEEDEIIQAIVDEYYQEFVDIIADGRGMDEDRVRELGDGRIYTGRQALEEGLIDDLGSIDDVIDEMQAHLGANYQVVTSQVNQGFGGLFGMTVDRLFGDTELKMDFNQPRPLYMYNYE